MEKSLNSGVGVGRGINGTAPVRLITSERGKLPGKVILISKFW